MGACGSVEPQLKTAVGSTVSPCPTATSASETSVKKAPSSCPADDSNSSSQKSLGKKKKSIAGLRDPTFQADEVY